jgi:hypothetical protein
MTPNRVTRAAWARQRQNAQKRGIAFLLTFEQWRDWWLAELAKKGSLAKRGAGKRRYAMCRFRDLGPYALGNIYCGTPKQNSAARWPHYMARGLGTTHPGSGCWLARILNLGRQEMYPTRTETKDIPSPEVMVPHDSRYLPKK